jgi:hypothetical protein
VVGLTGWALAAGAVAAVGVVLLAVGLLPAGPPDLTAALARLDTPPARDTAAEHDRPPASRTTPAVASPVTRWWERAGAWAVHHTPPRGPLGAPGADLRLLDITAASFAAARAGLSAAGLACPTVLWALAGLAGLTLPLAAPAVVGAGLATAGWLIPAATVRQRAARARAGLRVALSAYLDLVALERAGAGSPVEALEAAAAVGHGAAFTLVRGRLALAARAGGSPYTALAALAEEIGVAELRDLADITATAADGAAIYTTLLAKSRSLRNAIGADAHAAANAASEQLVFPVVLLGTGFLLLVFYPALARLLAAG